MKKILIIANSLGGLYNFRYELLEELVNDYELHVYVPYDKTTTLLKKDTITYHKMNIKRRSKNPFSDYLLYKNYKKTIKTIKPDIILTYTIKPNVYGGIIANKYNIPFIANVTGLGTAVENKGLLQRITKRLYSKSFKNVNHVFFQNKENKNFFIDNKLLSNDNYTILPGSGVNLSKFKPLLYPNNDKLIITYLGRLMRDKGTNELLDSIEYLDLDKIQIRLVGYFDDDSLKERVNNLVNQNKLIYLPSVKDVVPIIEESHAIINPSYHEGMSNVLLEAAASGRPVLASNIPGCKETFDNDISGISFESKNTESLVEAINKFTSLSYEERKEMGLKGRIKIEQEFDRNIVVNKYINTIKKILKENS